MNSCRFHQAWDEDIARWKMHDVTPQTFFLNDFFSWNLSFRCFKVHHEFIIIFRNYFSIKWNFRKIYPVRSKSEQLTKIEFLKIPNE